MSAHENLEHAEHAEHASHSNKKIALLIAVLALFLAFSETLGKSSQTAAIADNIKASDTWNFFQAKTIRQTSLRIAAEGLVAQLRQSLAALAADRTHLRQQLDSRNQLVAQLFQSRPGGDAELGALLGAMRSKMEAHEELRRHPAGAGADTSSISIDQSFIIDRLQDMVGRPAVPP